MFFKVLKCYLSKYTFVVSMRVGNSRLASVRVGKYPGWQMSGWQVSSWQMSGWQVSGWQMSARLFLHYVHNNTIQSVA